MVEQRRKTMPGSETLDVMPVRNQAGGSMEMARVGQLAASAQKQQVVFGAAWFTRFRRGHLNSEGIRGRRLPRQVRSLCPEPREAGLLSARASVLPLRNLPLRRFRGPAWPA